MTKKQFSYALKNGFGNALIFLRECPDPMKYADTIYYCCTHNTCSDMQSEGTRGIYLSDAIRLTGRSDHFAQLIMARLERRFSDGWEYLQMLSILEELYYDGNEKIYSFMTELYKKEFRRLVNGGTKRKGNNSGFEDLCICLCRIDNSYFPRTVHNVGHFLYDNPNSDAFSLDWFYSSFVSDNPKLAKKLLNSVKPEYLAAFKNAFECHFTKSETPKPQLDELMVQIDNSNDTFRSSISIRMFGRRADKAQLDKLTDIILNEKDSSRQCVLLSAFEYSRELPDITVIQKLYACSDESLKIKCLDIMGRYKDMVTAEFAKSVTNDPNNSEEYRLSALLAYISSAPQLDCDYIIGTLNKFSDREHIHTALRQYCNRDKFSRRDKKLAEFFYRENPCSYCRESCIRIMAKLRCLSDELLNECLYDCNTDTRKYAQRILRRRQTHTDNSTKELQ
ncbi:MAG: hypothetical protein IJ368_01245 [Oscillospiraceae bacterium]|nr:hypothetical protein [Oscillospiraceae bacterium]